jgi:hypothetical protein
MFTFNLPEPFVNAKSAISTDICGFWPKMFRFEAIFAGIWLESAPLDQKSGRRAGAGAVAPSR